MMGWICACCFAAAEKDSCARCDSSGCGDCNHQKALLRVEAEAKAPDLDAEDYGDFLHRFEDTILPAYRQHFENDQRERWKTRLHVVRAMIFSQAMLNYRRDACGEKGASPANVRYAVALQSFGKLRHEPKGAQIIHLDISEEAQDAPVTIGRGGWALRSAGCAYSYLRLIGVAETRAAKVADLLREAPKGADAEILRDAYVLDRLHMLGRQDLPSPESFLQAAATVLKGEFGFLEGKGEHKDAREALISEAGLLMKMTDWEADEGWRKIGRGALARVEGVIDDYDDALPFLAQFYFEDPSHEYVVS